MNFVGLRLKPVSVTQSYSRLLLSICALTLALVTGCEEAKIPSENERVEEPLVVKKVDENKVTAAEAKKFAKEYLYAIKKPDTEKLLKLLDWDAIVDRIFLNLSGRDSVRKEYELGGRKILSRFSREIRLGTDGEGSYALLKTVLRGKDRHVIFRAVTGSSAPAGGGRIDYHNLRLIKIDGKIRADDIYVARSGAWLSETSRSTLRPVLLQSQKPKVGFTTEQKAEMNTYLKMAEVIKAAQTGNHTEASKLYEQLPEELKKSKSVLTARLVANEREEFFKAADAMISHYPNSPAVGLYFIDFGLKNKDLPTIKKGKEILEKWTAGDPYVDLNLAAATLQSGDVEEATEIVKTIDVGDFDFRYPVYVKFNLALRAEDNETTLECCRILRDDYGVDIKELLKAKICQKFRESLEYVDLKND